MGFRNVPGTYQSGSSDFRDVPGNFRRSQGQYDISSNIFLYNFIFSDFHGVSLISEVF